MLKRARVGKGRSGLQSAANNPPPPQPPQQPNDGTQEIRDPQDLLEFFKTADDTAADNMLQQWRNEPLDADGRQQNTDIQRFFNYIGWTSDTPEVLTEKQYQQALQQAGNPTQFYHSDNPYGGHGAREFATQFMGGATDFAGNPYRQFVSGGIHGDGTYFAPSASNSAAYGTSQFRGFLNSNAKVIDERTLDSKMAAFERQYPAFSRVVNKMTSGYSTVRGGDRSGLKSMFAAMLGYNVIHAYQHYDYHTVINRSAITVSSKTKKARGGMANW